MKLIYLTILFSLLLGCEDQKQTTLAFSSEFKLSIQASNLTDATIFYSDALSIKTSSGKLLSGFLISHDLESLPDNFDIRHYPKFILGIDTPKGISKENIDKFKNSSDEIDHVYGLGNLKITKSKDFNIYKLCKNNECLAFIVKNNFKEHILSVNTIGFTDAEFNLLIKGSLYVKP